MWLDRGRLAHRFETVRHRNLSTRKLRRRSCSGRGAELRRLHRALLLDTRGHRWTCAVPLTALAAIAVSAAVSAALSPPALLIAFALLGSTCLLEGCAIRLFLLFRRFALLALAASRVAGRTIGAWRALAAFVARPLLTPLFTAALLAAPVAAETLILATFGAPAETIALAPVATLGPL